MQINIESMAALIRIDGRLLLLSEQLFLRIPINHGQSQVGGLLTSDGKQMRQIYVEETSDGSVLKRHGYSKRNGDVGRVPRQSGGQLTSPQKHIYKERHK